MFAVFDVGAVETRVLGEALAAWARRVVAVGPRVFARVGLFGKVAGKRSAPTVETPHQLGHRYSLPGHSVRGRSVTLNGTRRLHSLTGPRCRAQSGRACVRHNCGAQ